MRHLVFVYGTLLRGERNHAHLRNSQRCGRWCTPPAYTLFSLVSYPVACSEGHSRLYGEVYRVSGRVFRALDALEEYPYVYHRRLISTAWGPAWIYLQTQPPQGARLLPSGRWRSRPRRPMRRRGFEPVSACQPFGHSEQGA